MLYLFTGNNALSRSKALDLEVDRYLGSLKEDPYSRELIFMDDKASETPPIERVFTAVDTPSFFADKRAIVLKNFDALLAKDLNDLVPFLVERKDSEISVFIEASSVDSRSKMGKLLKKEAQSQDFANPKPWEMPNWIKGAASNHGFQISDSCAHFLSEFLLPDCEVIDSELEKLRFQFPDLSELTEKMILENLSSSNEGNVFQCLNAFGLRNRTQFLLEYKKLRESNYAPIAFTTQLFNHVYKILRIQWMLKKKMPNKEICSILKINSFLFNNNEYPKQCQKRSIRTLERILIRISEIDEGLKKGQYQHAVDFELALLAML